MQREWASTSATLSDKELKNQPGPFGMFIFLGPTNKISVYYRTRINQYLPNVSEMVILTVYTRLCTTSKMKLVLIGPQFASLFIWPNICAKRKKAKGYRPVPIEFVILQDVWTCDQQCRCRKMTNLSHASLWKSQNLTNWSWSKESP